MRQLCRRLNEWWRTDERDVRFEQEDERIVVRVNCILAGLFFVRGRHPWLHLILNNPITEGIEYHVSRVVSASWDGAALHRVEAEVKS